MPRKLTIEQYKQHCAILNLNSNLPITSQQIAQSYRSLAYTWHPDRNKGNREAVQRFAQINNARDELTDHILFFGNTLSSAIYKSDQQPSQNLKRLMGNSQDTEFISVPDAINNVINLTPHVSPIQKKLLSTIVDVINRFDINNFSDWKARINDAKDFIKNAIDRDMKIVDKGKTFTELLIVHFDRIIKYFDDLKLVLDEYKQSNNSEQKDIRQFDFHEGLSLIQSELTKAKQLSIANQNKAPTEYEPLPDSELPRLTYINDASEVKPTLSRGIEKQERIELAAPQIEISLEHYQTLKNEVQQKLRYNPLVIISANNPGPYIDLQRALLNLHTNNITSDALNHLIDEMKTAYRDLINPDCKNQIYLANALIPLVDFLFKAFPSEFKRRQLANQFNQLHTIISAPPQITLNSPPPAAKTNISSCFAKLFCCFFNNNEDESDSRSVNDISAENEPLLRRSLSH